MTEPTPAAAEVGEHKPYRITDRMLAEALDREKTMREALEDLSSGTQHREVMVRKAKAALTAAAEVGGAIVTEADIAKVARLLEDDPKAREAARWLWNAPDSDQVRHNYFKEIVAAVIRALKNK